MALEHDTSLFDRTTAARLLERLGVLCAAVAADPERPLSALPVMTEAERHQVEIEWGAGEEPASVPVLVHRRFEEWAARAPEALAIGGDDVDLTYGQLDCAANRLAHGLLAAGAGAETRVAVSVEQPAGWTLALLAVFKAGAVYVPLDPRLPAERRELLMADSGASVLVTEETLRRSFPDLPETPPAVAPHPGALAYIIYTSGSTGAPKGVGVPYSALARHIAGAAPAYRLGPGDRLLGAQADGFDASIEQLLAPLVSGAAYFPRGGAVWSAAELAERMERWGITAATLPTVYWRQVVADLAAAGRRLGSGLRYLEAGGEAMPLEAVRRWPAVAPPGARLCNGYGPTETVITPTSYEVRGEIRDTPSGSVPIGRPVAGRSSRVVDRRGQPVPIGVAGELLLGEPLARGYFGRPDATAAAFVPDPDPRAAPGSRLYRTGDRVRRLADGNLEYLGRLDRQIKLRGYRIEPAEIEAALLAEPEVAEAAVVVQGDRLVAWLVAPHPPDLQRTEVFVGAVRGMPKAPRVAALQEFALSAVATPPGRPHGVPDGIPWTAPTKARQVLRPKLKPMGDGGKALHATLRRRLPEHMIPAAFVWIDALPLTATGKVDRRALAQREIDGAVGAEGARLPPRDEVERALAAIWEELLGVRPVGVRDDFFALGGHSLLAVRLASRVEARFGRPLPIATLFERRTVEALAGWLRPSLAPEASSPLVRIQPGGSRPPLFMVHPGGGGVLCYADLARALGPDQPLYGLQALGLDAERAPLDRIGDMAGLYLEAVRAAQPAGPWHLGGWSFGGLVAYEMACRLAEQREPAGLVAILDVPPRDAADLEMNQDDEAVLLVRGLDEAFLRDVPLDPAELRGLDTRAQVALVLSRARQSGRLPDGFDERRAIALVEVFKANLRAARAWEPRPYPGRVTVVRAAGSDRLGRLGPEPTGGWETLATASAVTVPGDHRRMVEPPFVKDLAAALRSALEEESR